VARISEGLAQKIVEAVTALPVLETARAQVDWEIAPALIPDRKTGELMLAYMVAVSLPVPGSVENDKVLYMAPLDDPDAGQEAVASLVQFLYDKCQAENDARRAAMNTQANGHRESPGGLILP
jgi:hypothetical protein